MWQSVENLSKWMVGARRVLIVGNGGIALELVHAIISSQACQVSCRVREFTLLQRLVEKW